MARRVAAGEDRRNPVNTRIRDGLRTRLEDAAKITDRTLSHEIEERLERSFYEHDVLLEKFGTMKNVSIASAIVSAWAVIESVSGKPWTDSVESIRMAREAAGHVLDLVKPDNGGKIERRPVVAPSPLSRLGEPYAGVTQSYDEGVVAAMAASIAVSNRRGDKADEAIALLIDAASRVYLTELTTALRSNAGETDLSMSGSATDAKGSSETLAGEPNEEFPKDRKKTPKRST